MTQPPQGVRRTRWAKELEVMEQDSRTADGWRPEGKDRHVPWLGAAFQEDGTAPPDPIR